MKIKERLLKPANGHVLMVSFLLGGVGALLIGLQQSLKAAEESMRPALKAVAFIQTNVKDEEAAKWAGTLPSLDPEIESVDFISRAEALQKAQSSPALTKSLMLLHENPFPSSLVIRYKDGAWLDRPEPGTFLRTQPFVQEIRWDPEARSIFRSLRQWRAWTLRMTVFGLIMLGIWCFFGVYRFLAMKAPLGELIFQLGIGLIGGSLAVATWGVALRNIGSDAALYRPNAVSGWPLVTALMAALATFGWKVNREE